MNKIFKLFMLAVVVLGFSSCYNEFEEPAPAKVLTKEDFSNSKLISIKDFKQLFYKEYGNGAASPGKTRNHRRLCHQRKSHLKRPSR